MKILLLNDSTHWYHFGCTATSIALIEKVKALGHQITTLAISETYKIRSSPNTQKGFLSQKVFAQFVKDNPRLIRLIRANDALVINGEGMLHGLHPAPASVLYIAYIAKTYYDRHVEILNHSAYPQDAEKIDQTTEETVVYKLVYDAVDYAAIREPVSFVTLQKLGIHAVESFDCLPIYIKDHYKAVPVVKDPRLVLIAGSAAWLQLNIPSAVRGNIDDFADSLKNFNRYLTSLEQQGYRIKFLYGANAMPAKDDREFLEYMGKTLGKTLEVHTAASVDDWLHSIASAAMLGCAAYCVKQ